MPVANVRRRGVGNPDLPVDVTSAPPCGSASSDGAWATLTCQLGLHPHQTLATNHVAKQGDDVEQGRGLGGEFLGGSRALLRPARSLLTNLLDLPQRRADAFDGPVLLATAGMNLFNK